EAVAIGMAMAFKLSAEMGLCSHSEAHEVREHLNAVGLPTAPPAFDYNIDKLMQLMASDKKAEGGKLTLILARGIGKSFVAKDVDPTPVRKVWQDFLPR